MVEKFKISGCWAQTVTVGYERIKGLRAIGPKKSQVAIQHGSLPDRQSAARIKEFWAERLAPLERALTPGRLTG